MRDLTLDETIAAKHSYERFLHLHGILSKAYHADNGRFADQGFRDDCMQNNQIITICGVGSRHQNEIAERKIKYLKLCARTMLLHAKRMLPEYISTILWPFALKCAEDRMNNLVHQADGQTPFRLSLVWIKSSLMFRVFILLVVLAMFWITIFNLAIQQFRNGIHGRGWVCMLDVHLQMLQMLH